MSSWEMACVHFLDEVDDLFRFGVAPFQQLVLSPQSRWTGYIFATAGSLIWIEQTEDWVFVLAFY